MFGIFFFLVGGLKIYWEGEVDVLAGVDFLLGWGEWAVENIL